MSAAADVDVWMVAAGGRLGTGGICRMVDYACAAWSGTPPRVIDSGGMERRVRMGVRFARSLALVAAGCASGRVRVLHVHVAANGSVARKAPFVVAGRAAGARVVLHLHGADFEEFHSRLGRRRRAVVSKVFRAADAVVVLGERARAHMQNTVGVAAHAVHVLANAVPDPGRPAPRARDETCRLLFLGVLSERKGLGELLEALADKPLAGLDWRLEVVGNGETGPWRDLARQLGLGDRIRFTGWLESAAARARLAASDVLVLPSRHEGLPMVILEAMAAGVPVLATDVGEVGDAVVNEVTGLLVPPGDPVRLAAGLARLVSDGVLRASFGEAGRARFEAKFGIEQYESRLRAIFTAASRPLGHGLDVA